MTCVDIHSETVARRITRAREACGLSKAKLAAAVGTPRHVLIGWEAGRHMPNAESRRRLCEALGCPDLFGERSER